MNLQGICLAIVLAPLAAALVTGLGMRFIPRAAAHWLTILGVGLSFLLSTWLLQQMVADGLAPFNLTIYDWGVSDGIQFQVGFLVDRLTALMITVVTFVSLMV
ncbi:MAG TPA: NADH-quinone oxidoreductase subunit L, partial [Gammaproteobacteria bacterium]|nr:NADH-quinone oxidoreductase subunit L [Gammaproteobacteria bacterium]